LISLLWTTNCWAQIFAVQQVISTVADGAYVVYAADVDGDIDVLSASYRGDKIAWYMNNPSLCFSNRGVDVQTACDSYTWIDGVTYTSSNNSATHTLTNAAGCDSIVTLNLSIITVDAIVTQNENTLTSNVSGASYQWIDCATNSPIAGATTQRFTATINRDYAVEITENGCTSTSSCFNVLLSSLEVSSSKVIQIYPNPTKNTLNINLGDLEQVQIQLLHINGQLVRETAFLNQQISTIDLGQLSAGIYLLKVVEQAKTTIFKVIKE